MPKKGMSELRFLSATQPYGAARAHPLFFECARIRKMAISIKASYARLDSPEADCTGQDQQQNYFHESPFHLPFMAFCSILCNVYTWSQSPQTTTDEPGAHSSAAQRLLLIQAPETNNIDFGGCNYISQVHDEIADTLACGLSQVKQIPCPALQAHLALGQKFTQNAQSKRADCPSTARHSLLKPPT